MFGAKNKNSPVGRCYCGWAGDPGKQVAAKQAESAGAPASGWCASLPVLDKHCSRFFFLISPAST